MNKNIIITVLLIIVLCLGGYLVFDKKDNNIESDNKVEENINGENGTKENGDYDLSEAKKLMQIYVDDSSKIFDGLTSELKLRIAYRNLNYSTYPEKISYDEINKIYKELFGGEEASKQTFLPGGWCRTYIFNLEQNSYILEISDGCGELHGM